MAHGYSSPLAALDAVVACLGTWPVTGTVVHTGSAGSGLGIDCCPALVRVETASFQPLSEVRTFKQLGKGCKPQALFITVSYRECWVAQDNTKSGKAPAEYTAMGQNVVLGWWTALERMACCSPANQLIELVDVIDHQPDGCVGWDMTLQAQVSFCGCTVV